VRLRDTGTYAPAVAADGDADRDGKPQVLGREVRTP
jgi:hypothetical protein